MSTEWLKCKLPSSSRIRQLEWLDIFFVIGRQNDPDVFSEIFGNWKSTGNRFRSVRFYLSSEKWTEKFLLFSNFSRDRSQDLRESKKTFSALRTFWKNESFHILDLSNRRLSDGWGQSDAVNRRQIFKLFNRRIKRNFWQKNDWRIESGRTRACNLERHLESASRAWLGKFLSRVEMPPRNFCKQFGRVRLRDQSRGQVQGRLGAVGDDAEGRTRRKFCDEKEESVLHDLPADGRGRLVLAVDHPIDDEDGERVGRSWKGKGRRPEWPRFASRRRFVGVAAGEDDLERTLTSAQQVLARWSLAVVIAVTLKLKKKWIKIS